MAGVWAMVPGRSATEALCLLAMHHLEAGARRAANPEHVEVQEVVALKNAAATLSPTGPFMADEIAADPEFAAKVLAHLGGMPADGSTPHATYTKKQNAWIHAVWANHGGDDARKAWISRLTSGRTDSSSELTEAEKKAYIEKTEELS